MNSDELDRILAATETYRVEILHPGADNWNHIHPPNWETTDDYVSATTYAVTVVDDHPGAQVRIVAESEGGTPTHIAFRI